MVNKVTESVMQKMHYSIVLSIVGEKVPHKSKEIY
jgi:hypothetical protein